MPSTVIANMRYDDKLHVLRVEFVSGLIYEYKEVPEQVYHEMKTSGAKGIYLNKNIKGKYRFEKIN